MNTTILIVDDRIMLCESLQASLEERGYRVLIATSGGMAVDMFHNENIQAVLLDIRLGEEDGMTILPRLATIDPLVPVIVITGYGTVESAVTAIKEGAFDYLEKPVKVEKLLIVLENAIRMSALARENRELKRKGCLFAFTTRSRDMKSMLERVTRLAISDLPILIRGESGTGKELVAEYIHQTSPRAQGTLEKINCAAFPESLLDNELFGHEKGAFTGADSVFRGVFERAHGGTLFLDEVGDMPPAIQAKILRAIQNKEIRRIGGSTTIKVDIRFLAATNQDLETLVAEGAFRSDLLYRLNAATVRVPLLCERPEDIVPLAEKMLADLASADRQWRLSPEAAVALERYSWPGNVRELKSAVHYACTVALDPMIRERDLPESLALPVSEDRRLGVREGAERSLILRTLSETGHNKKKSAQILQMSRVTLYNKMKKYGIGSDAPRPA